MSESHPSPTQHDSLQLRFAGQPVRIEGDIDFDLSKLQELSELVTEMIISETDNEVSTQPRVIYKIAEDIDVNYNPGTDVLHLNGPLQNFRHGSSLVYLAEYLAACTLAREQGDFLTHAAAIYDPLTNRSQVLFGEKGAGKTTLAIRACKEGGREIIGNDQVYIGNDGESIHTRGGNDWFNIRRTAIVSDGYLSQVFDNYVSDGKPSWNDKIKITPKELGIARKVGRTIVGQIYHVRIDQTQNALFTSPWQGVQQNLILHERLGRHISGQATPLQDDEGQYLGSLPLIQHEITMRRRDDLVKRISAMGITEVFAPDGESATNFILNRES